MMNTVNRCYRYIRDRACQAGGADGRLWIVAALVVYYVGLWIAHFGSPYAGVWTKVGVPAMTPTFADARGVLAGFECTRKGYDVLYTMPCDPYGRGALPYPRLWMLFRWTGLGLEDTFLVGVALIVSWYAVVLTVAGRLNKYESAVYVLILCSPVSMLLVERSNVDLLIWDLLFLVWIMIASHRRLVRAVGYALILVPSFLKLLPIFAIGVALKEKQRWQALLSVITIATSFIVYCVLIRDELRVIRAAAPTGPWFASGARLLPRLLYDRAVSLCSGTADVHVLSDALILIVAAGFIATAAKIVMRQLRRLKDWSCTSEAPRKLDVFDQAAIRRLDAFRIGTCIFLGTFIATVNFDYKLTVLLFTIPQLLHWIKHDDRMGLSASMALIGMIAMFYAGAFLYQWAVDEMINWSVAGYLLYALLMTLPDWAKAQAKALFSSSGTERVTDVR